MRWNEASLFNEKNERLQSGVAPLQSNNGIGVGLVEVYDRGGGSGG
jgi:hypothetical protein